MMSEFIFILLIVICLYSMSVIHKYYDKKAFYVFTTIASIASLIMSFKLVKVFGININMSIVFNTVLIFILYYFVTKYNHKETNRLIFLDIISILLANIFLITTAVAVPSVYDRFNIYYQHLVFDNLVVMLLYPISTLVSLLLSRYCMIELSSDKNRRVFKTILTMLGITFIYNLLFVYFSYAFLINFSDALVVALDNYLVQAIMMIVFIFVLNKIFKVKKVKE